MLFLLSNCIIILMLINGVYIAFQTEGYWQGLPALFIICANPEEKYQSLPVNKIHDLAEKGLESFLFPFIVIGGEPTDQSEETMELITIIKTKNKSIEIQVETNAAGKMAKKFASCSGLLANIWLTVSPLEDKEPDKALIRRANELKLLVSDTNDNVEFCKNFASIASPLSKLRFQPKHEKDVDFNMALENSFYLAKEFGGRVSIPLQKFVKMEKLNFNNKEVV